MKHSLQKLVCLLLAALFLALSGCGFLSEEDVDELAEDAARQAPVQNIGEQLQDSYKADHVFSLNSLPGQSFNPYTTGSLWNRVVSMLVYETLVKTDDSFEAQPNLITRWESADGMNWTFYVDTSRSFHDGGVMTAVDAMTCVDMARAEGQYARRFAHVTGLNAVSEEAFTVTLDQPNWRFYQLLNIPCVEAGTFYNDMPPGTGPYKFNSRGTALQLDTNHPLADKMPLKSIRLKRYFAPEDILQAFEDSLLDLVVNNPLDMSSLGYSSTNLVKYVETSNLHYLGFNMTSRLFSQPIIRAMMTYAIDRDAIVSTSMQGAAVSATLPIHPSSPLYPKSLARGLAYSEQDLAVSLQNAGAQDIDYDGVLDFGPVRAEITFLVCSDSAVKVSAARQIATQLRNVGFSVIMAEQEYADYIASLESGAFDMYYGEVKLCDDWDLSQLLGTGGDLNYGGVRDPNLEGYIGGFLSAGADALAANAETLYSYLAQSAPIVAVCFERTEVLYHRGVLTTIDPTQDNIFNDMQNWVVDLE